jgi:transcriptional regulator GlxA family with amidase domain
MLGISPMRYARLRRLKQVRLALRDSDPDTISVSSLAARYGFTEPKRFALQYRAIFGESPSTTLHRSPVRSSGPSSIFAESA